MPSACLVNTRFTNELSRFFCWPLSP
ncbi:hypothetical protein D031_1368A, partial [Vibrio parahaemolyticus VP-48]